jgi:branched-chain amino acid transport system ATP-binding protein
MISTSALVGGYGRLQVLAGIALNVESGELVAVLGANGAGKSTLLRCIQGVIAPTSGQVRLGGVDVRGRSTDAVVRMGLTMVPESRALFPSLSVADNLLLGAFIHRKERDAERKRDETLRSVYRLFPMLEERSAAAAGTLSGGQQQMLAIGRALMTRPRALMLDEPSLGLAPLVVKEIFAALGELKREGLALLVVEQNARSILQIAQRAYVLERGKVVREGAAAALARDQGVVDAYLGTDSAQPSDAGVHAVRPKEESR